MASDERRSALDMRIWQSADRTRPTTSGRYHEERLGKRRRKRERAGDLVLVREKERQIEDLGGPTGEDGKTETKLTAERPGAQGVECAGSTTGSGPVDLVTELEPILRRSTSRRPPGQQRRMRRHRAWKVTGPASVRGRE